jgi:hypothetical protein
MERTRVIIESPLKGDFATNRLYATWCCRHVHECGYSPLASHLVAPWFLDDRVEEERLAGITMPWFWQVDIPHFFFTDLGESGGMLASKQHCLELGIRIVEGNQLPPPYLLLFKKGEAPPHTPGFGP